MPDPIYTPPPPAKRSAKGTSAPRTRLAPRLAPIPHVYDRETDKVKKVVKKLAKKKPVQIHGADFVDDQFHVTLTFSPAYGSDAGRTYGAMLPLTPGAGSPEGGKEFYVRALIEQNRTADPQLQGFGTVWEPPPGWVAVDGLNNGYIDDDHVGHPGIWDESISNPLYVTRVFRSPSTIATDVGFRVVAVVKYLP